MDELPPTQYQHYVPQFMLRRFAIAPPDRKEGKNVQMKKKKGNEMVKAVDLTSSPPKVATTLVRKTFGQHDMYKDDSKFSRSDQNRMERKLGDIDQNASRIIARAADAHATGKEGITLSRSDKDLLRKFQFVMKYRGPIFFRRFNHQNAEAYDSNDRIPFLEYMRAKGFTRPLDVWFDNLTKIIDAPIDPKGDWMIDLIGIIYPPDAIWLFTNIRSMHLAFITPSDPSEEFILTENAFGIHEGPVSYSVNAITGEPTMTAYTEFHVLTVISPHLAMILRHNSLPEPLEDLDPYTLRQKKEMLAQSAYVHVDPEHATSLLEDLPLAKARNSYTTLEDGRLVLAKGADGIPRARDTFHFIFFRLETKHVQTVNLVMLDQSHTISRLVFKSESALRKALEFYLSYPVQTKGLHSVKTVGGRPDDPVLLHLRKLEQLACILGSDVKAIYHIEGTTEDDEDMPFDKVVAHVLENTAPIQTRNSLEWPMKVLMEILLKTGLNIVAVYALDKLLADHGQPLYPDLVYAGIQAADLKLFNESTKTLLNVDRQMWRVAWDILVDATLQRPDANLAWVMEGMRGALNQIGVTESTYFRHNQGYSADFASKLSTWQRNLRAFLPKKQADVQSPQRAAGLSKQGLSKAFDAIGRDIHIDHAFGYASSRSDPSSLLRNAAKQTIGAEKGSGHMPRAMKVNGKEHFQNTFLVSQHATRHRKDSEACPSFWIVVSFSFLVLWFAWR